MSGAGAGREPEADISRAVPWGPSRPRAGSTSPPSSASGRWWSVRWRARPTSRRRKQTGSSRTRSAASAWWRSSGRLMSSSRASWGSQSVGRGGGVGRGLRSSVNLGADMLVDGVHAVARDLWTVGKPSALRTKAYALLRRACSCQQPQCGMALRAPRGAIWLRCGCGTRCFCLLHS